MQMLLNSFQYFFGKIFSSSICVSFGFLVFSQPILFTILWTFVSTGIVSLLNANAKTILAVFGPIHFMLNNSSLVFGTFELILLIFLLVNLKYLWGFLQRQIIFL